MLVEFLGPSGAGKSTICTQLLGTHRRELVLGSDACYETLRLKSPKSNPLKTWIATSLARHQAKKTGDRQLFKTFGIPGDCVDLCNFVFEHFRVSPDSPDLYFERLRRFQSVVAQYSAVCSYRDLQSRPVVFDEFFAQKCLAMSFYVQDRQAFVAGFTERMPKADLYVYVESPFELLRRRIIDRGRNAREVREHDMALTIPRMILDALEGLGANIVSLDGTRPVIENVERLGEVLFAGPGGASASLQSRVSQHLPADLKQ